MNWITEYIHTLHTLHIVALLDACYDNHKLKLNNNWISNKTGNITLAWAAKRRDEGASAASAWRRLSFMLGKAHSARNVAISTSRCLWACRRSHLFQPPAPDKWKNSNVTQSHKIPFAEWRNIQEKILKAYLLVFTWFMAAQTKAFGLAWC